MSSETEQTTSFEEAGKEATKDNGNIVSEFVGFLKDNKKWWLVPILVALLVVGAILGLAATGAAPFIYTLF